MRSELSIRARLLAGAAAWSFGLFTVAGVLVTLSLTRDPRYANAIHRLLGRHHTVAFAIAFACLACGFWQFRIALSALQRLRERLGDVRAGRTRQIDGAYPVEVQPLVDDLNALLDLRERAITRAVARAGDLAHGLKTPLAVLSQEADRAAAAGHDTLAATIGEQVERMRRQVDHHLAHARAAASGATTGVRCNVAESAEGLARALRRLHVDRVVAIDVDVPAALAVRAQREDMDEMLGNLLDNACAFAASRVMITGAARNGRVMVHVDDDGPGLADALKQAVLKRGVRADEATPGSGLGLAIVLDVAAVYGGTLSLETAPAGGLRACLDLPGC